MFFQVHVKFTMLNQVLKTRYVTTSCYHIDTTPVLHQYTGTYDEQFAVDDMQNPTKQLELGHGLAMDRILRSLNIVSFMTHSDDS